MKTHVQINNTVVEGKASPDDVFETLNKLNILYKTHEHPALFTVEESKALRGNLPGGHCKNLFLRGKKNDMWLLVCREDLKVDLKLLGVTLGGARLSFGSSDRLMRYLGVCPGSVSPFALINDTQQMVKVVLDSGLMKFSLLNFHPLTNEQTTSIAPNDLIRYIEACGHKAEILDLN
ncbi:MAG: DNA-binding protein [Rhodospirillaceae bacterium]|nr:DNA-binding protein [Rhodospirillaceae bacterium]|tara:strand:- start:297 stop:827 length:531 start_codon:yes stop_codon:yes gene_type:complete